MAFHERRDDLGMMRAIESADPRLGRVQIDDPRDEDYPLSEVVPRVGDGTGEGKTWNYWWPRGWSGDQGSYPHCVAYAWAHWAEDGPRTRRPFRAGRGPAFDPESVYHEAQGRDRWPGSNYSGTSIRAGAKVLQARGFISEYRWAENPRDVRRALLTTGPLVVGTWWHNGMYSPDDDGFIRPTGGKVGGHAYVVNGINLDRGFVRIKNSWGTAWGYGDSAGFARIRLDDLWELLRDDGEACLAIPKGGRR